MSKPINAAVVNAFVSSLREVLLSSTGIQSQLNPLKVATESPEAPNLLVRIEMTGGLNGPAICSFEPGVARQIAAKLLLTAENEAPEFESPECKDALAELMSMLIGNATGPLLDQGIPLALEPPTAEFATTPGKLEQKSVKVSLSTRSGEINLYLCLTQA